MESKRRPEQIGIFQPNPESEDPEKTDVRDSVAERLKREGHEPAKIYVNPNDATLARRKVGRHYMDRVRRILKMGEKPGEPGEEKK